MMTRTIPARELANPELTPAVVTEALRAVAYPGLTRDLVSFGMVQHVSVCDARVKVRLALRTADLRRDTGSMVGSAPVCRR